ncbi:hypothetical protein NXX54_00885 [Bacteroides sp. BFG-638]|uniref:hypothetical protein n=1 Tax=unclassified Bacteroides TaxID=2646097 RepID=UPI00216696C6|nr:MULTISPECIES: hypothetical protein [unclassified Bacteroides]MCS2947010.1 hypothetical protein [Bacteroides sp. BFG-638]MCS3310640.1 hypothetical protein [Bacteroides sp. BFG-637]
MTIRKNTNSIPLDLPVELQDILIRNGMRAHITGSSNGFSLTVQGHDSPVLTYPISEKQLMALTDGGTNFTNKRSYNTFASIVAADFDIPKDFVHARNANGRVAMGVHGYRIGAGEYGRAGIPRHFLAWGERFLGWTPRQQEGFHLRRIGGNLYYPGAPMVPERPDGRMKPGELQSGGYGFYYKGQQTAPVAGQDVLKDLQSVITPIQASNRSAEAAKPYKELIASPVYFTNEKWQECLGSHGIIVDAQAKKLTIQSTATQADFQYDLTDEEVKTLTHNSIKEAPVEKRMGMLNEIIKEDFNGAITLELLSSNKSIDIPLQSAVQRGLNYQLQMMEGKERRPGASVEDGMKMGVGWFREGQHGREVTVDAIRVEPITEGKYKMTAVIDGETVSHEISQKQYDKFMAIDDFHRMKLFSKIFGEVELKSRGDGVALGTKIGAAFLAGATLLGELGRGFHDRACPDVFMEHHGHRPEARTYFKPGVDTPMDVAARNYEAAVNTEMMQRSIRR